MPSSTHPAVRSYGLRSLPFQSNQSPNLLLTWPSSTDQLSVTGGGSATPATVLFPGAYSATDPGILINIYEKLTSYTAPGPAIYSGGSSKVAGAACSGVEAGTAVGPTYVGGGTTAPTSPAQPVTTTKAPAAPTTLKTSVAPPASSAPAAPVGGCTVAQYGQCGGTGFTGCTTCAAGTTCKAVSAPYYSQCQ